MQKFNNDIYSLSLKSSGCVYLFNLQRRFARTIMKQVTYIGGKGRFRVGFVENGHIVVELFSRWGKRSIRARE